MLAQIQKHALAIPAPNEYDKKLSWKAIGVGFAAGADPKKGRVTFCDEAIQQSKKVPSCADYNLEAKYRDENGDYNNIELGNIR